MLGTDSFSIRAAHVSANYALKAAERRQPADLLEYLPRAPVQEFRRGEAIYSGGQQSQGISLIIRGKVKLSRVPRDRRRVVLDIYTRDEFFGESAISGSADHTEAAVALERTQVMQWATSDVEALSMTNPRLAFALTQLFIARSADFLSRIESLASDLIEQRLARLLIRFSERLGKRLEADVFQLSSITHEVLAEYIGTSRESVTQHMQQFRKRGILRYSRSSIRIDRYALQNWLQPVAQGSGDSQHNASKKTVTGNVEGNRLWI